MHKERRAESMQLSKSIDVVPIPAYNLDRQRKPEAEEPFRYQRWESEKAVQSKGLGQAVP